MTARILRGIGRAAAMTAVASCVLLAPIGVLAQTATDSFDRAKALEQQLGDSPTADALRKVARAYEAVVLRYPNSGHCDNALWEEAALLERAFALSSNPRDRADAAKALEWLAREYPASPMVKQAAARAAALKAAPLPSASSEASAPSVAAPVDASPSPSPGLSTSPSSPQAPPPPSSTQAPLVRSITRAATTKGDRLTIELTGEVTFYGERVPSPDRVFFDFPKTTTAIALSEQLKSIQSPLIKTVRVGSPASGTTRVVVELTGSPRYNTFVLYGPYRVVIDFESTTNPPQPSATPLASVASSQPTVTAMPSPLPTATPVSSPPPSPTPVPSPTTTPAAVVTAGSADSQPVTPASNRKGGYSLPRQLGLRVARIVIDPGHGGHDPGAIANGVTEADLVLDVALRLEKLLLQTPGVEVVLTRRTNEFVPLEERTAIANRERADLFLSIHANSHSQPAVRGLESYFLNFASNPDAEAVAARENAASVERMGTLPAIVKAITLNSKLEESRELATLLQASLVKGLNNQPGGSRDLGVKQAPFVVLIGATMPSVLTEIGFLTNKTEAGLFKQPGQRQLIAQSLRDAIVRYQDSLKRVSTSTPQTRRE